MKQTNARRTALIGMLFALAMVLSFFEGSFVPLLGLPPGVKLGLANVVVMYALFFLGKRDAAVLVVLKSVFSFFTRDVSAGALSFAGGILSLLVMLLLQWMKPKPSLFILSVCGAIAHNFGQLLMLQLLFTQSIYTLYYAPVLLVSGLIMGSITAVSLKALLPALEKLQLKHY